MFKQNEYVVYGSSGVCVILEICTPDFQGIDKSRLYYKLKPINTKGSIIYTPVENEQQLLRSIITKEQALVLIDDIPNIEVIEVSNEKLREYQYKEALKKNSCREWIKIIKTLYMENQKRLLEGKKASNSYMKYQHDAEDYLYSELSIPLEVSKDKIEDFITNRLLDI